VDLPQFSAMVMGLDDWPTFNVSGEIGSRLFPSHDDTGHRNIPCFKIGLLPALVKNEGSTSER
jgi:hypothetical protein